MTERILPTNEYLDTAVELLRQGAGEVALPIKGRSMRPFLWEGDTAYLRLPERAPKRGDVLLYLRPDGRYILHRVRKVYADGHLDMIGDGHLLTEKGLPGECVRAVAFAATRKGKRITEKSFCWRFFRGPWLWMVPLRKCGFGFWGFLRRTILK